MRGHSGLRAAEAFQSAFGVVPEVAEEVRVGRGLGIYRWKTPVMDGFELPETDDLIVALHLGGSRQVRAVTDHGLSRSRSAPGMVTVLPPGRPAAFRTAGSVRIITLHVAQPARASGAVARLARASRPLFALRDHYVSASMEALLRAAHSSQAVHPDYVAKVADALLCHLSQWAGAAPPALPPLDFPPADFPLQSVLDHIDKHLHARLGLDQLAALAGVSRAAFAAGFRAATGMPAHRYITWRRVKAAEQLLRQGHHDLAYIAQETGFCSQSHFTAIFRALTGVTPGQYRVSA
ncbi:MAG: helix-turn-helix transcriptional regulator [Nevskia sp.]|nr:helix-turn-helix transcriptional regulator [Nevskia sp.]